VDFCILCGCDYTTDIEGIGPARAYSWMKKHGNLDIVIKNLREMKKMKNK